MSQNDLSMYYSWRSGNGEVGRVFRVPEIIRWGVLSQRAGNRLMMLVMRRAEDSELDQVRHLKQHVRIDTLLPKTMRI
jgi:hypothetical protein